MQKVSFSFSTLLLLLTLGLVQGQTITIGVAQTSYESEVTSACTNTDNYRTGLLGEVTDDNGTTWIVPADVAGGFKNIDIYNDCTSDGDNPNYESELITQVIDEDGSEITAFLFGDNYYELYVNGTFAGRDAVNFTTFNTHVARFQASYPITYAVNLVDWEEYNGIGMEELRGQDHIGDGGFIATFSDGTSTNDAWVCKAFYMAPFDDASSVPIDENGNANSAGFPSSDSEVACVSNDPQNTCQALHLPVDENWMSPNFDDSGWLPASYYTGNQVTSQAGYSNYADTLFANTNFIWSSNLVLDNHVVCRLTVEAP